MNRYGYYLLIIILDSGGFDDVLLGPYKDLCLSSKAKQIASFSFEVVRTVACFLRRFVEKNDRCCSISWLGGVYLVSTND